jgi:hypothetical protein
VKSLVLHPLLLLSARHHSSLLLRMPLLCTSIAGMPLGPAAAAAAATTTELMSCGAHMLLPCHWILLGTAAAAAPAAAAVCTYCFHATGSCWPLLLLLHYCTDELFMVLTQSVALSRRMSDTDSVGISTLTRLMLPHGSVFTLLITCSACKRTQKEQVTTRQQAHDLLHVDAPDVAAWVGLHAVDHMQRLQEQMCSK